MNEVVDVVLRCWWWWLLVVGGGCLTRSPLSPVSLFLSPSLSLVLFSSVQVTTTDPVTGTTTTKETGTGCAATCNSARGTCETINGNMQCLCKPNSMWASGNADSTPNTQKW